MFFAWNPVLSRAQGMTFDTFFWDSVEQYSKSGHREWQSNHVQLRTTVVNCDRVERAALNAWRLKKIITHTVAVEKFFQTPSNTWR